MTINHSVNNSGDYQDVNDIDVTDYGKTVEGLGSTIGDVNGGGAANPNAMRSEYVPPSVRQARRQARALPFKEEKLRTLSERIGKALSYGGIPKPVHEAANEARDAIAAARMALELCRDPEMPSYANGNAEDRSNALAALGRTEMAVTRVEQVARDNYGEMRDSLVAGLAEQQEAAADALKAALDAYSAWRRNIGTAAALGAELGLHGPAGSWAISNESKETGDPMRLINGIADALKVAKSDDEVVNGQWMVDVADSEGLPEFLIEHLRTVADRGDSERWDVQVARRLLSPHREDYPARDSIREKDLRIVNSQPVPAGIYDIKKDPAGNVAGIRDMRAETAPRTPTKTQYESRLVDGVFQSVKVDPSEA
ncbi:hypothetical protein [Nocardioides panzhihuensis]|uniref:Uncharacterized protein n=1 Tax=Nocardioides panzhihuensis TaxID=860243 RepID=A0A7Z0IRB2_9ACTN|nr:hypothetical protein [Nocardioides panzhihuensis]NYI76625.1 hypothetical protein [Nocardioides panzhihuensis]